MTTSELSPRVKLDDALLERIKTVLGDDDDVFAWLWAEYLHLRMCFNDLKNGFGGDAPPMIHLWAVSPEFEKRYRNLLVEEIVLAACRLTDNETVSGHKTISISMLPEWFAHEPNLKNEMKRLVKIAADESKALRTWRNRQLAHTAKKRERAPVSGDETEATVDALHAALAFVWRQRFNEEPEAPQPRPASAALGEHLSRMHERTVKFAAWLLDVAGHDAGDDIYDMAAAVRRLAAGSEAEAADARNDSDPVVEFFEGAREAREVTDRIGDSGYSPK